MNESTFNAALIIGLSALISFLAGLSVTEMQTGSNPKTGALLACIAALCGGLIGGVLATVVPASSLSVPCIIIGTISGALPIWLAQNKEAQRVRLMHTQADNLQAFLLKHFDRLDRNADGLILKEDLEAAMNESTEFNRYFIKHCLSNFADVGHEESSHTEPLMIDYPGSHGLLSVPQKVWDYAINADDVATYPERINRKYAEWFHRSNHSSR